MSTLVTGLVMLALLLLKGFFSGSEIALVNADRLKLGHRAKQDDKGARTVLRLLRRPERILATTLVGTNIATVVLTTLGTLMMVRFFGEAGDLYAVLFFTPFLLILGEIVPKSVFQQQANRIAPAVAYPLQWFSWIFFPIVFAFSTVARYAGRLVGRPPASAGHLFPARDQLRHLIEMADRASGAELFDRTRIERAVRFSDTTVGERMIPLGDVVGVDRSATTAEAVDLVRRRGFAYLPVFEGHMGNVVGIASLTPWDILDPAISARPLSELIGPALYLSPLQTLDEIHPVLRARDDRMGIVVDEFGSAVGIITLTDVMEAVVGDIETGLEFEDYLTHLMPGWQALGEDVYLIDGRLPISELNDLLELNLPSSEFHTVSGMVLSQLRHLATPGESLLAFGYRFTVVDATERTIRTVRAERDG